MQIIAFFVYYDNIPSTVAIFVYNSAFDITRSVQNVSCTLLHDVKLACNKHSDIEC